MNFGCKAIKHATLWNLLPKYKNVFLSCVFQEIKGTSSIWNEILKWNNLYNFGMKYAKPSFISLDETYSLSLRNSHPIENVSTLALRLEWMVPSIGRYTPPYISCRFYCR